jgi:hypothetical protein
VTSSDHVDIQLPSPESPDSMSAVGPITRVGEYLSDASQQGLMSHQRRDEPATIRQVKDRAVRTPTTGHRCRHRFGDRLAERLSPFARQTSQEGLGIEACNSGGLRDPKDNPLSQTDVDSERLEGPATAHPSDRSGSIWTIAQRRSPVSRTNGPTLTIGSPVAKSSPRWVNALEGLGCRSRVPQSRIVSAGVERQDVRRSAGHQFPAIPYIHIRPTLEACDDRTNGKGRGPRRRHPLASS